jgi:hypothetical protein
MAYYNELYEGKGKIGVEREKRKETEERKTGEVCFQCKQLKSRNKSRTQNIAAVVIPDWEHQRSKAPSLPLSIHADFIHCMPTEKPTYRKFSVFTAGSIEMGQAVQWQQLMANCLRYLPITVLNHRCGNWDPSDVPKAGNAGFKDQVEWELEALEKANVICFFFDVTTQSPVTMLELGLWAASRKIVVCCDPRFWRSGNVELTCSRYGIPFVKTFAELVTGVRVMLADKGMVLNDDGNLLGVPVNERPKEQERNQPVDRHAGMPPPSTVSS